MKSRHLTVVPREINKPHPLTSNHFIQGRATVNYPPVLFRNASYGNLLMNKFPTLAINFFVNTSQTIQGGTKKPFNVEQKLENLGKNDLVWLLEDFTSQGLWPLAKVIEKAGF